MRAAARAAAIARARAGAAARPGSTTVHGIDAAPAASGLDRPTMSSFGRVPGARAGACRYVGVSDSTLPHRRWWGLRMSRREVSQNFLERSAWPWRAAHLSPRWAATNPVAPVSGCHGVKADSETRQSHQHTYRLHWRIRMVLREMASEPRPTEQRLPRGPSALDPEDRARLHRQRIQDAFVALVAERGLPDTSIRDICAGRAGRAARPLRPVPRQAGVAAGHLRRDRARRVRRGRRRAPQRAAARPTSPPRSPRSSSRSPSRPRRAPLTRTWCSSTSSPPAPPGRRIGAAWSRGCARC